MTDRIEQPVDVGSFKAQLAKLDELIKLDAVTPIDGIQLVEVRSCVATVMKELNAHPELDSIIIDNDIHNIVSYVRKTKNIFEIQREEKGVKREVRKSKSAELNAGAAAVSDAMARLGMNLFGAATVPLTPAAPTKSVTQSGKRPVSDADRAEFAKLLGTPGPSESADSALAPSQVQTPPVPAPDSVHESQMASAVFNSTPDIAGPREGQDSSPPITDSDPLASFKTFLAKRGG